MKEQQHYITHTLALHRTLHVLIEGSSLVAWIIASAARSIVDAIQQVHSMISVSQNTASSVQSIVLVAPNSIWVAVQISCSDCYVLTIALGG